MSRISQSPESMRFPTEEAQGDSQFVGSTDQLERPTRSGFPVLHDSFIKGRQVAAIVGVSLGQVNKLIRAGRFPKPVHIGAASRWSLKEVQLWMDDMLARRAS